MIEMMIAIVVTTVMTPLRLAVAVANGAIIGTMIDEEEEMEVVVTVAMIVETIDGVINGAMNTTKIVVEVAGRTHGTPATPAGRVSLRKKGDAVAVARDHARDPVPDPDRLRRLAQSAEPLCYRPLLLRQEVVVVVCYRHPPGSLIRCYPNHSHHCYLHHPQLKPCWEGSVWGV
uniref:Putative secreted protein n=1 Tax=Anopheles darlingi TaxID=43151 RepID=A0A2M4D2N9_ANODA